MPMTESEQPAEDTMEGAEDHMTSKRKAGRSACCSRPSVSLRGPAEAISTRTRDLPCFVVGHPAMTILRQGICVTLH